MYTSVNFPTKKALKEAVERKEKITLTQPFGLGTVPMNGTCSVEGPHYPRPHTWYAVVTVKDGLVVKVR